VFFCNQKKEKIKNPQEVKSLIDVTKDDRKVSSE